MAKRTTRQNPVVAEIRDLERRLTEAHMAGEWTAKAAILAHLEVAYARIPAMTAYGSTMPSVSYAG